MKEKAKKILSKFLKAWSEYDINKMYDLSQETWKNNHTKKQLKRTIEGRIKSFEIVSIDKMTECVYDATIIVRYKGESKKLTPRLICESEAYQPSIKGSFGVNPISLIKKLY